MHSIQENLALLLITSLFYGLRQPAISLGDPPPSRLRNQGYYKAYINEIKGTTKAFKDIKRLKDCRQQCLTIRKRQFYKKIPVFGSRTIEKRLKRKLVVAMGRRAPLSPMGVVPLVPQSRSLEIAHAETQKKFSTAKLVIYPTSNRNYLAWMVDEKPTDSRLRVFIDAKNGELVDSYDNIAYAYAEEYEGNGVGISGYEHVFNVTFEDDLYHTISTEPSVIKTSQYQGDKLLPGRVVTSTSLHFDHPSAVDAHGYTQKFMELLKNRFNRRSFDNAKAPIISTVDYYKVPNRPYTNAFWNGSQVVYGIGGGSRSLPLSGALDILVHEITHAITQESSGLIYRGESGALNEAFSDIMATYVEHQLDPANADWSIGEDVWTPNKEGDAIRYMDNPTRDNISRDHYQDRYTGYSDNQGVHLNSGIVNMAFYLLVHGGQHPRKPSYAIKGIGLERAMDIFYQAFTSILAPSAKFIDARDATVLVAREFDEPTVLALMQAWASVGVGRVSAQNDGAPLPGKIVKKVLASAAPNLPIPDYDKSQNSSFLTHTLAVTYDVQTVSISVDIEHPYQGDLYIRVFSPTTQMHVLHNRVGKWKDNLKKTYIIPLARDETSVGTWALKVSDHSRRDVGVLKNWSISAELPGHSDD